MRVARHVLMPCNLMQSLEPAAKTTPNKLNVVAGEVTSPQLRATYAAYAAVFDRMALSEGAIGLINVRVKCDLR